jgi:dTDP-4-dehydrorhamnose 3,5-epimerase
MRIVPLAVEGALVIEPEPVLDSRGFFARTFSADALHGYGLDGQIVQCSVSYNERRGTLRGMHYQAPPHEEGKLVRCTAGAIHDVILDMRPSSPTFGRWVAVELTAANRCTAVVPKGCAHGFQTLVDRTEVFYQMTAPYVAASGRRVRYDDPAFRILWPLRDAIVSDEDRAALAWAQ